ncbi:MAG TPA: M15 family metallopeptidase [Rhodopila sp.]|nr:M15 family metallopeptidase [Rhodopila sp.]
MDDLLRAYPDDLADFNGGDLVWRDGTRMAVDDGQPNKSLQEQLRHGSILDQLRLPYSEVGIPQGDAGRIRNKAFFDKMYGDCRKGGVTPRLVPVVWLPKTWGHVVRITSVNGIDRQLAAISDELDKFPTEEKRFLYPPGGTYNCRDVADSDQISMHGWGAAIDINPAFADYWLWHRTAGGVPTYIDRIPLDIVSVFEHHSFIWGGRWAHFDTMHFEYRPELLGHDAAAERTH